MEKEKYHPESYWSQVGKKIKSRENGKNVIAGDDEPYYRYKRRRFLEVFNTVNFENRSVLEIGSGPGGNLLEVLKRSPKKLTGVDISSDMIALAKDKLPNDVDIIKVNGTKLPFEDDTFDIVFSATVLQHNTDEEMLKKLVYEICRVGADEVFLFERVEPTVKGDDLCHGRPVSYYSALMDEKGYDLVDTQFINVRVSYYVSGAIRKGLNSSSRVEGEPLNGISNFLQNITLPVTSLLDKIFTPPNDVAKIAFKKRKK